MRCVLDQIEQRKAVLRPQCDALDRLDHQVNFEQAQGLAGEILRSR